MNNLKIYSWVNVLRDHYPGIAVTLAHSKEEALENISQSLGYPSYDELPDDIKDDFKKEEPDIDEIKAGVTFHRWG
jgi:hypothetical protein